MPTYLQVLEVLEVLACRGDREAIDNQVKAKLNAAETDQQKQQLYRTYLGSFGMVGVRGEMRENDEVLKQSNRLGMGSYRTNTTEEEKNKAPEMDQERNYRRNLLPTQEWLQLG